LRSAGQDIARKKDLQVFNPKCTKRGVGGGVGGGSGLPKRCWEAIKAMFSRLRWGGPRMTHL